MSLNRDWKTSHFRPALETLISISIPTHMIISGFLRKSKTFVIYDRIFRHLGLNELYIPYELPKKDNHPDIDGIVSMLSVFRVNPNLRTLVISDPYKQTIVSYLDHLERRAEETGAVNLIFKKGSTVVGDNIDGDAFYMGITEELNYDFKNRAMIFLGCGGVSSAIAVKLANLLSKIALVDIVNEKANSLRDKLKRKNSELDITVLSRKNPIDFSPFEIIYNGTGLGKFGNSIRTFNLTPFHEGDLYPEKGLAVDANYTPWVTAFLKHLSKQGMDTCNGFSHMIGFTTLHISFVSSKGLSYETVKNIVYSQ